MELAPAKTTEKGPVDRGYQLAGLVRCETNVEVKAGDELLTSYGNEFWNNSPTTQEAYRCLGSTSQRKQVAEEDAADLAGAAQRLGFEEFAEPERAAGKNTELASDGSSSESDTTPFAVHHIQCGC